MKNTQLLTPVACVEMRDEDAADVVGGLTLTGSVQARGIIVVCRTGWAAFEQSFVSIDPIPTP